MRVKLHELRQGSSPETYINDFDTLARNLEINRRFIISSLGSSLNWNWHFLSDNPRHDDAVTFAKRKRHFADTDSDTQLMGLLQEIGKEISLKHTGIKQEPYSAPAHDTHTNHLQQNTSQLQRDIQSLKRAINPPHTQYAAPLDTNPAAFQQQLSKMKAEIRLLQQMTRPNTYPASPGNYRRFQTTDGLVICRRCNQVGHFARACPGNLPPPRAPTPYQNHRQNYVPPGPYHHQEHPHLIRITDTTMSLLAPPNIHGRRTLPVAPPINITNTLPIDPTPLNWRIFC